MKPDDAGPLQIPPVDVTHTGGLVNIELHSFLLNTFFTTIHEVLPILDPDTALSYPRPATDSSLQPPEAFILHMVYAIACHCVPGSHSNLLSLASASHQRALYYIETVTAEPTIVTLQASTLLALHSLFEPRSGNYSQQIGFAVRLAIDLAGSDSYEVPPVLISLQSILFCLENQANSIFIRPTSLQEPARPITFIGVEPLELLCSLYRTQARCQRGELDDSTKEAFTAFEDTDIEELHPNIASAAWETRFMLNPSTSTAARLVDTYTNSRYIATFLTPYWIQRAGSVIVDGYQIAEGVQKNEMLFAYSRAVTLLGSLSTRWTSAKTIAEALQVRMKEGTNVTNGVQNGSAT